MWSRASGHAGKIACFVFNLVVSYVEETFPHELSSHTKVHSFQPLLQLYDNLSDTAGKEFAFITRKGEIKPLLWVIVRVLA